MPRRVEDYSVADRPSLDQLTARWEASGGFTAKAVGRAVDVLARMFGDEEMTVFLSFPADLVATGLRGVLCELIELGRVDAVITTCGTLDHDLARAIKPYYHGEWELDDAALHRRKMYRLGNVVIPQANYGGVIERRMQRLLERSWKAGRREWSTRDLVWAIGEDLGPEFGRGSICRAAFERKVPVFVPGITDGAVGSQLWLFGQTHRGLRIDLLADEQHLSDLVFEAKRSGAFLLGGGISKHHTIWWNQFRGGLDAAVYVTTAVEWDGSLSGARTREAISWGKLKPRAPHVTVDGDATVIVPLLVGAALERTRKSGTDQVPGRAPHVSPARRGLRGGR
ncbi:MAG TPA: deoxyhypusine synthase [Thermoplasmata archaeon]|nr:deoxyhypusine synthase [Thermoplasmata archaeon]